MRAHKDITFFMIAFIALAGIFFLSAPHQRPASTPVISSTTTTPAEIAPTSTASAPVTTVAHMADTAAASALGAEAAAPAPSPALATIRIGDRSFPVAIHAGTKVMDTMQTLQAAGQLTYTSQEYPGMGLFIDSINGKKNANGLYWILYINETSSAVGASSATISPGDTVEWRYKNSY